MSDIERKIRENVRCCSCGGSLEESRCLNVICLDKRAAWRYPAWGNLLVLEKYPVNRASAVVCDRCLEEGRTPEYAIEWSGDYETVRYHRVEELEDLPGISPPRG